MTPKQDARSGLKGAGEAGDEYQTEVVSQIEKVFGASRVRQNSLQVAGVNRPAPLDLTVHLSRLNPFDFLVEAKFAVPTAFAAGLGLSDLRDPSGLQLDWSDLNPDILLVVDTGQGEVEKMKTEPFWRKLKATQGDRVYVFDYYGLVNPGSIDAIQDACKKLKQALDRPS